MPEKVLQSLESFEYLMLAICTVGIVILVAKSYGINVGKEGYASGPGLRFSSMRDDGVGAVGSHNYEGYRASRSYDGMIGSAEPPVFWGNVYDEVAAGQEQAAGLNEDNADGDAWVPTKTNFQQSNALKNAVQTVVDQYGNVRKVNYSQSSEGAVARRNRTKEGMLDAALAGGNVTAKRL